MSSIDELKLDERSETLLRMLIARFIDQGYPVGSRTLSHEPGLKLSAATIRNVMADLEDLGLIASPHTSAGRVPTTLGYRMFIDSLVTLRPVKPERQKEIKYRLNEERNFKEMLTATSELLSDVTQFAGIVFLPKSDVARFRQIEFVNLSDTRILVILITEDGQVQNRVISNDRNLTPAELTEASNFFNDKYRGKSLSLVKEELFSEMKRDREQIDTMIGNAISIAQRVLDDSEEDVVVRGEENLFNVPDFAAIEKVRKIFETFKTRHSLLSLLDQSIRARGVSIFIGSESGYSGLDECSVVTAPYEVEGESLGAIGVIGPTRMRYDRVIPIVDVTAQMLSNALLHLRRD